MNELFAVEESLSPRLAWLKKHKVTILFRKDLGVGYPEPWEAYIGKYEEAIGDISKNGEYSKKIQFGETADESLFWLIKKNGWHYWNEEELVNDDNT